MNLQLLSRLLKTAPLALSTGLLDHASHSSASRARSNLDELSKPATLDTSHLTMSTTFPTGLASTPCRGTRSLALWTGVQTRNLHLLCRSAISIVKRYFHIIDQIVPAFDPLLSDSSEAEAPRSAADSAKEAFEDAPQPSETKIS